MNGREISRNDWVVVPHWDKYQHYKDRNPPWIKLHTKLLHEPEFLGLSGASRGLLMTIWMLYSVQNGPFTVTVLSRYGPKVSGYYQLISLSDAGFIELSASKPLAASTEVEGEIETPSPLVDNSRRPRPKGGGADVNQQLLHRAFNVATEWEGPLDGVKFADALDTLEKELHAQLPVSVRERLWDEALKRDR